MSQASAKLHKLPAGIEFPPELRDRVWFDESKRQIIFHGAMFKREFDELSRLSDDLEYRKAIEQIFRDSAYTDRSTNRLKYFAAVAVVALLGIALTVWLVSVI